MKLKVDQFMNSRAVSCMSVLLGSVDPLTGNWVQNLVLSMLGVFCMLRHFYKRSVVPDRRLHCSIRLAHAASLFLLFNEFIH